MVAPLQFRMENTMVETAQGYNIAELLPAKPVIGLMMDIHRPSPTDAANLILWPGKVMSAKLGPPVSEEVLGVCFATDGSE